jgi:hypothetical protein
MKCGHPLAARKVSIRPKLDGTGQRVVTTCWACEVERQQR